MWLRASEPRVDVHLGDLQVWIRARAAATKLEAVQDDPSALPEGPGPPVPLCQGALWDGEAVPGGRERDLRHESLGKGCIIDRDPGEARLIGVHDHRRMQVVNQITSLPGGLVAKRIRGGSACLYGGRRGVVYGFSKASRKRFRRELMEADWQVVDCSFGSFTYHNEWGDRWSWKRDLKRFGQRLERRFGDPLLAHYWRQEFQGRGAPHFHLLMLWEKGKRPHKRIIEAWCKRAWAEVIGTVGDVAAEKYGVKVIEVGAQKGELGRLLGYLLSEMGKVSQERHVDPETGEILETGRAWGVVGDVPKGPATVSSLTQAAWDEFVARVNALGKELKVWYYSAINANWAGFTLMGSPGELGPLLEGLAIGV